MHDDVHALRLRLRRWAPLPLRLLTGYGLLVHGYTKLANGPERFGAILAALHVPAPGVMAWWTIGWELVGGLAVLVGLGIPWITVPMSGILLVAAVSVHLPFGFSSIKLRAVTAAGPQFGPPGMETALLYVAALITLSVGGAGPWSLDDWWRRRAIADADGEMTIRSLPEARDHVRAVPSQVVLCQDDDACDRVGRLLADRIYEFNASTTGYHDGRLIAGVIRNDAGDIIAGFDGHTWGGYCAIAHLWVDVTARGQGLGSALLHAAEQEAASRGCHRITLGTHTFQAPAFYERRGYRLVATLAERPTGYDDLIYEKSLR